MVTFRWHLEDLGVAGPGDTFVVPAWWHLGGAGEDTAVLPVGDSRRWQGRGHCRAALWVPFGGDFDELGVAEPLLVLPFG